MISFRKALLSFIAFFETSLVDYVSHVFGLSRHAGGRPGNDRPSSWLMAFRSIPEFENADGNLHRAAVYAPSDRPQTSR